MRAGLVDEQIEQEKYEKNTQADTLDHLHLLKRTLMPAILPQAETQFLDASGNPLNGGSVYTYVVGTTTPKTTWQDPAGQTENANPITLDSGGRCILFGVGAYRQQVYDASGNLIWDQTTAPPSLWDLNGIGFLVDTGAVNALVVTLPVAPASLAALEGIALYVQVGNTNTGAATLDVSGLGAVAITQGGSPLGAGALVAGALYPLVYTGSAWQLPGTPASAVTLAQLQNGSISPTFGQTVFASNPSGEADIGVEAAGLPSCYLFSNANYWGLYSTAGGEMLRYNRSTGVLELAGGAVSIDNSANLIVSGNITAYGTPV